MNCIELLGAHVFCFFSFIYNNYHLLKVPLKVCSLERINYYEKINYMLLQK